MPDPIADTAPLDESADAAASAAVEPSADEVVVEELLVEEVSIDGMCGVY